MPELLVVVDEKTVALKDCVWVFYEPCGCPRGVMNAVIGDAVAHDEATAWREHFGDGYKRTTVAAVKRERKRGVTSTLMHFERYRAEINPLLAGKCPHAKAAASTKEADDAS